MVEVVLFDRRDTDTLTLPTNLGKWLVGQLAACGNREEKPQTLAQFRANFETVFGERLENLWHTEEMDIVRAYGLLVV